MNDDATQFSYFRDNELTQLAEMTMSDESSDRSKTLEEGSVFLNKYKILKILGEGSFSLIYLLEALDASKKLLVAKEFFPKGFVARGENNEVILKTSLSEKEIENFHFMKDIFIGEAQNLVKVSKRAHPNVLNFFALEENVNNTMYLITDYEEGITLKAYIKERKKEHKGKLTNQEITGIATGLLNGLGHIHKVKVYHQDIKLENILIRHDQYPLLLDFGASIILYDKKQKKYFNATTPRYAAPEQVALAQPPEIDERTDIYELGVLLYKLVTDEFPPKASERLKAVEEGKDAYIPLEIQKPYGYDINVLKAVDRALELEQVNRFQNADDFKKSILHKKASYKNFLFVGLGLLIPLFFGIMYMFWPQSKGTVKLNLQQQKYFVYSDGKKISLSEEKTISLSAGKHQLTIIKDGYMPHEVNVTIKENRIENISGKLVPLTHKITLASNTSATFTLNGRRLVDDTFDGHLGDKYSITTEAANHFSKVTETDYIKLHKNNFKFYEKLLPVETKVNIIVDRPFKIGRDTIKVNGDVLNGNILVAQYNKAYKIDIENPYYKKVHLERTYEELNKNKEQKIILKPGYGNIRLKGLPAGVTIEVYEKYLNESKLVTSQFTYLNKEYTSEITAFDQIYLRLSKEGYETINTLIIDIKNNTKYVDRLRLRKVIAKKRSAVKNEKLQVENNVLPFNKIKEIVIHRNSINDNKSLEPIHTNVDKKVSRNLKKQEEVKNIEKKQTRQEVVSKKTAKKNIRIKTVKYKIKNGDTTFSIARAHHTTVKEVRKQNNFKRDTVLKIGKILIVPVNTYVQPKETKYKKKQRKRTVRKREKIKKSSYIWYCIAGADGTGTWSARASTKQVAALSALSKCRKKRRAICRVSNCYILGNSYNY